MATLLSAWLKRGDHLPAPLKDFDGQTKVFRCLGALMQKRVAKYQSEHCGMAPPEAVVNATVGQIYVIDCFLWFMAKHGYTLQKTRLPAATRPEFDDLQETLNEWEAEHSKARMAVIKTWIEGRTDGK